MREIISSFKMSIGVLAAIWIVYFASLILPFDLQSMGIRPWRINGLFGIFLAPFIHANIGHLIANSLALFTLLIIAFSHNQSLAFRAVIVIIALGGMGTWIFGGSNSVHIGASGVIFGLIGYLLFIGYYQRDLKSIFISVFIFFTYGATLIFALIPAFGVSWSSHFFGFIGGICAAEILKRK
jgi:membrane associated rhomboid family serine protease